jgi:hypothetical protein
MGFIEADHLVVRCWLLVIRYWLMADGRTLTAYA